MIIFKCIFFLADYLNIYTSKVSISAALTAIAAAFAAASLVLAVLDVFSVTSGTVFGALAVSCGLSVAISFALKIIGFVFTVKNQLYPKMY
jgi:hypothetical protein